VGLSISTGGEIYFGNTMMLVGFVIECGEPGACVTPVEVTI
jgi:hypothetical protein